VEPSSMPREVRPFAMSVLAAATVFSSAARSGAVLTLRTSLSDSLLLVVPGFG